MASNLCYMKADHLLVGLRLPVMKAVEMNPLKKKQGGVISIWKTKFFYTLMETFNLQLT